MLLDIASPHSKTATRASTLWIGVFSALGLGLLLLQAFDYINFGVDDVFITLRYAQNAADGHGLVFNPGEYVEGYSNFLWTILLTGFAVVFNTSYSEPYTLMWIAKGLSFASGLVAMYLLYQLALRRLESRFFSLLTLLAVIGTGPFVLWMCGGLEGTFYAMILTGAVLLIEKYKQEQQSSTLTYFGLVLFLGSITRPEVAMHAAAMFAALLLSVENRDRSQVLLRSILPYAVLMAGFLTWRWFTYHELLPNTFYAKTGGGLTGYVIGVKYLLAGMVFIAGPMLLAIPLTIARGLKQDITIRVILALLLSTGFFVAYGNGDWMAGFRFVMPLTPILMLLGMETIRSFTKFDLGNTRQMISLAVVTLIVLSGMIFSARQMTRGSIQTMATGFSVVTGHSVGWHEEVGNWLRDSTDGKRTIALGEVGMISYLNPDSRVIDLYGLMDHYIAHTKKAREPLDPGYLFNIKPDYILVYGTGPEATIVSYSRNSGDYPGIVQSDPRFKEEYQLRKRFISLDLYERKPGL